MSSTKTLGTELGGYLWELSIEPSTLVVEMRRTRFRLVEGVERGAFYTVALAQWDGERLALRRLLPNPGDPLRLAKWIPFFEDMIRMAHQGG
jgi:hypothetical protein